MGNVDPPLAPDELVAAGSEREVLATFLDLYRGIVAGKLAGLTEQDARRRLVPCGHPARADRRQHRLRLARQLIRPRLYAVLTAAARSRTPSFV